MEQFNKETNKTLEELKNRINCLVLYGFRYKQTRFFLHYQTTIRKVINLLKDAFESGKYQKGDKVRIVFKNCSLLLAELYSSINVFKFIILFILYFFHFKTNKIISLFPFFFLK